MLMPLLAAAGLAGTLVAAPPATPAPNLVVVSVDTLRADHLGCYGYPRPTSPAIDRFRRDAALFEQAIAQAPSTLPSHASLLTSLVPQRHGASWAARRAIPEEVVTLPEVLRGAGYRTAAFTGGGQMHPSNGLAQGFDLYRVTGPLPLAETVAAALPWLDELDEIGELDERRRSPFFLFLHTYETHHPYTPDAETLALFDDGYSGPLPAKIGVGLLDRVNRGELAIDARDVAHIVAAYDAEIRSMDRGFADLLRHLRERGLYEETMIVLTSDHGEEFGEHERVGWHSHSLYDELLRVPLVVKFPAGRHAGAAVEGQVRSLDVAPTALAALGIAPPPEFEGIDLAPVLAGAAAPPRAAVSRRDVRDLEIVSVRTAGWKLYGERLFDLAADPAERADVAAEHPETVEALRRLLAEATAAGPVAPAPAAEPDPRLLRELEALGYVD